jgi:hypothetical protein
MGWYAGGLNQRSITANQAFYQVFVALMASGWTALGSGDGLAAYSGTDGTALVTGASGANGFYNPGAWIRLQAPKTGTNGQKRELIFQQGNSTGSQPNIRIKYSPNVTGSTGFTGGSPSSTQTPSATDQRFIAGGGSEASPTYASWGFNVDYSFVLHVYCDNDGDDGYSFYVMQTIQSDGAFSNSMGFAMDVMLEGTAQAGDMDPCVFYFSGSSNFATDLWNTTSNFAFVGGIGAEYWVNVRLAQYQTSGLASALGLGSDPQTDLDSSVIPHWCLFTNTPAQPGFGIKGYSSLFQFSSTVRGAMYPVQNDPNSQGDRLLLIGDSSSQGVSLPWPAKTTCYIC